MNKWLCDLEQEFAEGKLTKEQFGATALRRVCVQLAVAAFESDNFWGSAEFKAYEMVKGIAALHSVQLPE